MLLAGACSSGLTEEVCMVDRIPTEEINSNYVSNKKPLLPQQFIKLPSGSIKPGGWLLTQLQLQKDGLNGHLGEISAWLQKEDNAWLTAGGKWGWEEVPYWLRGYAGLAYLMEDEKMMDEAKVWIEAILKSQREDGNFGPYTEVNGSQDFWPNMIALWILQSYYEYTNDVRVIDFMTRYFHFQLNVPDEHFLKSYWENSRGGDNLWSVVWLYNRTGDSKLLELADKIHRNTADWTKSTELPNWHNVNVAQGCREPATYYLFNGDRRFLEASYNVQSLVRRTFGQVPGGMFGADENARMGFFDPRQGTETCGFAEQMASDEIMLLITGDPYWAENCEDIAFNSYPAAFMPDYKSLRYITSPNMVISDSENHKPGIDNAGPFLAMNPFSSRCCQHNHGFAWPYYTEHLMLATPDNGAAAVLFNTCEAHMKVAEGKEIVIREKTDYPFDTRISFTVDTNDESVKFPFYIRIPKWTKNATCEVNGQEFVVEPESGSYLCIEREWKDGNTVVMNFPMEISYRTWQVNKNSVSVDYGPLTLSLRIAEKYVEKNSTETAIWDSQWQKGADASLWPSYEIYPDSPWNYALQVESVKLKERKPLKHDVNPFTQDNVPLVFEACGRLVPDWKVDEYKLCGVLPYENVMKSEEVEKLELVPMGAARLRISSFPTCE
ncbi:beta-L-arabinofuranosidase domain-containing protein [uncultured Bacteroides sp.]|uniref:beta-L-arabinofuranosidase domain-containing protein n=1 Tax=uncultured Bacteroides sp. TaxID=162156 RepID=UPI00262328AF|nr:beta-L-arabinofuranosidase domain-containing protein [uncultured Bacteroides sp.]